MRAMRGAERVVHIDVAQRGQLLREAGIVLLFFRVEAQVLEQHDAARTMRCARRIRRRTDAVFGKRDRTAQQLTRSRGNRAETHLRIRLALRTAQMRREDDASRARVERVLIVGSDSRMRVSSPMTPPLSGTLKSTRMNTRRPFRFEVADGSFGPSKAQSRESRGCVLDDQLAAVDRRTRLE